MRNEQIIDELELVKDHFKEENDGCFPLCLEEAQIALSHSGISSYIFVYTQHEDDWIPLKRFYWGSSLDLLDLWNFLINRYEDDGKLSLVLGGIFCHGSYLDVDLGLKYEASWKNYPLH